MNFTMTKIATGMLLAVAATGAQALAVSTGGVFNMYSQRGLDQNPGASVLTGPMNVDSTITGFFDYAAGTWGVASTTPFFGLNWTASGGTLVKTAGNYTLNTATGIVSTAAPDLVGTGTDSSMHFTVGAGQLAGVINFAWGTNTGIRVVDVWNINTNGSLTALKAPGMENGPFGSFNAAFHLTAANLAPVPEASTYGMMLAGLGLVGGMVARRRKLMA